MNGEQDLMTGPVTASQAEENAEPGVAAGDMIVLTIPAKPEYIALCRLAVAGLARLPGLDQETVADLKLVVTEACTYSLQSITDDDAQLEVGFQVSPEKWTIEVASPGSPEQKSTTGGEDALGLVVIRALVDDVELQPLNEARTVLRLVKRL